MNKFSDASSSRLTAKMNRDRLAVPDRPAIPEEEAKKGIAIRQNMARLRELRLAKEAQEIRAEISTGNRPTKPKRKSGSGRGSAVQRNTELPVMIRHVEPGKWYFVVDAPDASKRSHLRKPRLPKPSRTPRLT
jgi:hypothetical protein